MLKYKYILKISLKYRVLKGTNCNLNIVITSSPDPRENIRSIILRDDTDREENIEIRRVFVHPAFGFPSLYNDIAVAELGNNPD